MNKKLEYRLYVQRENSFIHEPFRHEQFIYNAIINGDTEMIIENQRKYGNSKSEGKGELSDNPLKNSLYHMIINTAVIARICMVNGLSQEIAYTLSDMYIRSADKAADIAEIERLNNEMTLEFAQIMKIHVNDNIYSKAVRETAGYICNNLHTKLKISEIADKIGYDRSYLSTLFKKETGRSIGEYIRLKRLDTAKNLLLHTNCSCSEIASVLSFASQSHFTKLFREKYGISPDKYRKRNAEGLII